MTATAHPTPDAEDLPAGTRTVSQLHADIAAALRAGLPETVWVVGEVSGKKQSPAGHVYLDLVERPSPGAQPQATVKVACLARDLQLVRRRAQAAGITITDGVEIRVQAKVTTYAPSGALQLQMVDIDAEWTVGRIAANRDLLLRRLSDEGVLDRNKKRPLVAAPLRVGLVTSIGSAAYHDFWNELESSGWAFQVLAVDTRVQGDGAPASIITALGRLARQAQSAKWAPDVVVVTRGGGSRNDLGAFDDEKVARAIAAMPVAVITAIGHEIDRSVADAAAHTSFKTPTAAAQGLISRVRMTQEHVDATATQIQQAASRFFDRVEHTLTGTVRGIGMAANASVTRSDDRLNAGVSRIAQAAIRSVDSSETQVEATTDRIRVAAPRAIDDAERFVDTTVAIVAAHDPALQLQRGFTITRLADGSLLSNRPVAEGTVLVTETADAQITSTVTTPADPPACRITHPTT